MTLLEPGSLDKVPSYVIRKLRKAGYHTSMAILNASPRDIAYYAGIPLDQAQTIKQKIQTTPIKKALISKPYTPINSP